MATRYTTPVSGATSGAGTSVGTATTMSYMFGSSSPVEAGDTVVVMTGPAGQAYEFVPSGATGNQLNQLLIRVATTGTSSLPIRIVGGSAAGAIDGTRPEFKAVGTGWTTNISMMSVGTALTTDPIQYVNWENLYFNANEDPATANTGSYNVINNANRLTVGVGTAIANIYYNWRNCIFAGSKHNGVSLFSGAAAAAVQRAHCFYGCEFRNCGRAAAGGALYNRGSEKAGYYLENCSIHNNNVNISLVNGGWLELHNCVSYRSGAIGTPSAIGSNLTADDLLVLDGCTFDNEYGTNAGTSISYTFGQASITNCNFTNCTVAAILDEGWDLSSSNPNAAIFRNCNWYGNATNYIDSLAVSGTPPGVGNQFIDPQYVSRAVGSEDFRSQNRTLAASGQGANVPGLGGQVPIGSGVPTFRHMRGRP